MPTLNQGLIEVCKVRPEDAIDYLVCEFEIISFLSQQSKEMNLHYRTR